MNLTFNESQLELSLSFADIMTSKIVFYDESVETDYLQFCTERNISYLPSLKDFSICYKKNDNEFLRENIEENQKVKIEEDVFDTSVIEKFEKYQVLFVYRKNELVGVVHFCDYNRFPVFIYIYSLVLVFENRLKSLLTYFKLSNKDMIEFFKSQSNNSRNGGYYTEQLKKYSGSWHVDKMKELEPFQWFLLKDLIGLANFKKKLKISESVNEIRNNVMHARNPVTHKDYELEELVYDFKSFKEFFRKVKLLQFELRKVTNKMTTLSVGQELL